MSKMFFRPPRFILRRVILRLIFYPAVLVFLFSCSYFVRQGFVRQEVESFPKNLSQVIRDLPLFPINGERFRLSELKNAHGFVIVMRSKTCPESEKLGPALVRLEQKYSKAGVKFIYNYSAGLDPKQREKEQALKEAEKDFSSLGFKGVAILDSKQKLISALDAVSSQEIFVLDSKRGLMYRGPVSAISNTTNIKGIKSPPPPPATERKSS